MPLDLASGEEALKDAVHKAESLFFGSGVDFMVHNAAFERQVCVSSFFMIELPLTLLKKSFRNHKLGFLMAVFAV